MPPVGTTDETSPLVSYSVKLVPSGHEYGVGADESVLDAALSNGLSLPYGCRTGTCGTCRGRLIEGEVDYPEGWPRALSETEAQERWALLCRAVPRTDLLVKVPEIVVGSDLPVRTLPCRVIEREQPAHDVIILHLKLPEGEVLQYLPGQYLDVLMRDGRRRSFSIANAPRPDDRLTLHIRHVPGGEFSGYVFEHLKTRALLRVRGPLGGFFLRERSERALVFVAGGTGLAPIKAILEDAFQRGDARPMHLYWGVRAQRDLYLHDLVTAWTREHSNLTYIPVLSEPADDDRWTGRTGLVHQAVLEDISDLGPYEVYSSGPPVMVDAAWETFPSHGLDPEHHFSDTFEFAYVTGADTV